MNTAAAPARLIGLCLVLLCRACFAQAPASWGEPHPEIPYLVKPAPRPAGWWNTRR